MSHIDELEVKKGEEGGGEGGGGGGNVKGRRA